MRVLALMLACLASFVVQTAGADELVTLDRGGDTWYDSQDGTTIGVYASYADTLSTEQGAERPEQHVCVFYDTPAVSTFACGAAAVYVDPLLRTASVEGWVPTSGDTGFVFVDVDWTAWSPPYRSFGQWVRDATATGTVTGPGLSFTGSFSEYDTQIYLSQR